MIVGPISEKQVERKLCEGVRRLGGLCLKWVSPGCSGVPDRIVLLPGGRVRFVELKSCAGRLSARQRFMLKELRRLGCSVDVLRGPDAVDAWLMLNAGAMMANIAGAGEPAGK